MNFMNGGADAPTHVGHQAVVIGGSLAGLMTARVLADHFDQVTILERDRIDDRPALHQSIPQGHHLHGLLLGGQQVMASLYPGFLEQLGTLGAVRCRAGTELVYYLPTGKAFSGTGTVREPRDLGFDITCHSRGLLESCVRRCTLRHPNITFAHESTVQHRSTTRVGFGPCRLSFAMRVESPLKSSLPRRGLLGRGGVKSALHFLSA
jgi:2-polyprenyl-6-methoxyphenol hydroxylase-like FAD-dependent oxidoreductase